VTGPGAPLRVSTVRYPVTALGPGRRLGIWVQGCTLACLGCMSQHTWRADGGSLVPLHRLLDLWGEAIAAGAAGVTISGGEPLQQAEAVSDLIDGVRRVSADAGAEHDVLLYTGYEVAEMDATQRAAMERADAVMVGRYQLGTPTELIWRGSGNQRLIFNTDLGVRRFEGIDMSPGRWPLQIVVEPDGRAEIIGVPRSRRHLIDMRNDLRDQGLDIEYVSWRDPDAGRDGPDPGEEVR
jgi:anaerobic ribonucleoside-triphosphate reductase activating protein